MNHKNKGIFVVFTHHFSPSRTQRDKIDVNEQCEFVDRLKTRHVDSATVIIDLVTQRIVKSRVDDTTFEQYLEYVKEKYSQQYQALLEAASELLPDEVKEEIANSETAEDKSEQSS